MNGFTDADLGAGLNDIHSMKEVVSQIDPVIRPLIPMFLEQSTIRIQSLASALNQEDLSLMRKLTHTLKGSCASYGFSEMAEVVRDLENDLRTRDEVALSETEKKMYLEKINRLHAMHLLVMKVLEDHPELFEEA